MPPAIHSFREKEEKLKFKAWLSVGLAPRKGNKTKLEFGIEVIKQFGTTWETPNVFLKKSLHSQYRGGTKAYLNKDFEDSWFLAV